MLTADAGAADLRACGIAARGADLMVEPLGEPEALRRAHARLFAERGVRYLDCEGGQTGLRALRRAGVLDEGVLPPADGLGDEGRHRSVARSFALRQGGG